MLKAVSTWSVVCADVMASLDKCFKCVRDCVFKEDKQKLFGFPCDMCCRVICQECNKIMAQEIRVIPSSSRSMLHLCPECLVEVRQLPKLLREMPVIQRKLNDCIIKVNDLDEQLHSPEHIEIAATVKKLENELSQLKVPLCGSVDDASLGLRVEKSSLEDIERQLKDQSMDISNKLNSVVEAIKDTNKELIQMLFPSTGIPVARVSTAGQGENSSTWNHTLSGAGPVMGVGLDTLNSGVNRDKSVNNSGGKNDANKKIVSSGKICTGPEYPGLKVANKNIGERIAKLSWIYLSNLDVNTTPQDVVSVLDRKYAHIYQCQKLPSKFKNPMSAAFRLGVPEELKNKYLSSDSWPDGCYVDEYGPKSVHNVDTGNPSSKTRDFRGFYQRQRGNRRRNGK